MSVEIDGVKGYEYQYLATIYNSLLYIKKESVEIYVEDTEDAKIIFEEDAIQKTIYLQSKKHSTSISYKEVCSWLGHFGDRQSENFLLSRVAKENHYVVFFSEGRCEDKASKFLNNEDFEFGNKSTFNNQYAEDARTLLLNQYGKDTILNAKRKKCISDFFIAHSNLQIQAVLKQVSILEQISFEDLLKQLAEILNKEFVVRSASMDYVIQLLDKCVRSGRDTGKDIALDMREILNKYSQKILSDSVDYIEVPDQKKYGSILHENDILLLTGVPFSGKTSLAKAIAQAYAQQGYEVKQTSDFDGDNGALSFLNSYTDDKRLLLLEDPFGTVQVKPDRVECVQKVQKLIVEKTAFNRKVIITTRIDILLTVFDTLKLDDCSMGNNFWWDQTIKNSSFACDFWKKLYGSDTESLDYFEKIKSWIEVKEAGVFLEIGEISHLKRVHTSINKLKELDIDKVITHARISSKTIVDKIKMGGADSIKVFLALGFCCNTIRKTFLDDLAYVLSSSEETPALIQRGRGSIRHISMGGGRKIAEPSFPQYCQKYRIESGLLSLLQQFEKQGYIFREKLSNEIYFAHPIFYYASKLLLLDELRNQWECDEMILLGSHGIGALNKNVNLCALDILWYCVENSCDFQDNVLALVLNSLNSIFPATKDKAVILLEKYFQKLSSERQDILVGAIKDYQFDKYLLWHNSEPFINPNDQIELEWDYRYLFGEDSPISIEEIKKIKSRQVASSQLIYDILNSTLKDDLTLDFLNTALLYDESIIREKAIYLIFKNHGNHLNDVEKYLIDFDNGNVIFALFRGALKSWFTFTDHNKNLIIRYFLLHLQRVSVAMQAKKFLETFGDDYRTQSLDWEKYSQEQTIELWKIWCVVFAEFFSRIPPKYLKMDEPHMNHAMEQVVKYVDQPELLLSLYAAWNTWLKKCRCPSDFGMCVMEKLLQYVPATLIGREQLFCEMLKVEDTSIITSHIKYIIDNWESTTQKERQKVNSLFLSNRNDMIWIKAVALARGSVPVEVQSCILNDNIFNKSTGEIVAILRNIHLLEYCINVHCGYPQPLWWNGYHHSNNEVWDTIISEVLKGDILDQSFEISLRKFVDCEYNYEQRFAKLSDEIWNSILSNQQKREHTFSWLIKVSATQMQTNKKLWGRYFNACSSQEKNVAYRKIVDFIEALQYYQDGDAGILKLFDKSIVFEHIYPLLESDMLIKKTCELALISKDNVPKFMEESFKQKNHSWFENAMEALYKKNPPRMSLTNVIVKRTMKEIALSSKPLDEILEERRCALIDAVDDKRELLNDHYDLANWN